MDNRELINAYFNGIELDADALKRIEKIRKRCIDYALLGTAAGIAASFSEEFYNIQRDYPEILKQGLTGQTVIELGPAHRPIYDALREYNISKYIAVEPFVPKATGGALNCFLETIPDADSEFKKMELSKKDGLSYLLTQPDNSAVVVSFGVICPELQSDRNGLYYDFLAKEIYRVTPKQGISIHVGNTEMHLEGFLKSAGFEIISEKDIYYGAIGRKNN